jgi:hypothetical protein
MASRRPCNLRWRAVWADAAPKAHRATAFDLARESRTREASGYPIHAVYRVASARKIGGAAVLNLVLAGCSQPTASRRRVAGLDKSWTETDRPERKLRSPVVQIRQRSGDMTPSRARPRYRNASSSLFAVVRSAVPKPSLNRP